MTIRNNQCQSLGLSVQLAFDLAELGEPHDHDELAFDDDDAFEM